MDGISWDFAYGMVVVTIPFAVVAVFSIGSVMTTTQRSEVILDRGKG